MKIILATVGIVLMYRAVELGHYLRGALGVFLFLMAFSIEAEEKEASSDKEKGT